MQDPIIYFEMHTVQKLGSSSRQFTILPSYPFFSLSPSLFSPHLSPSLPFFFKGYHLKGQNEYTE